MVIHLGDYTPGSVMVTDLVNTAAGFRAADRLRSPQALQEFLGHHGWPDHRPDDDDLEATRALRDRLIAVLGAPDQQRATHLLNLMLREAPHSLQMGTPTARSGGEWCVEPDRSATVTAQLQVVAATSLLSVLKLLGMDRFRVCASSTCTGRFVDTSRPGRRRFCEPAVCGNRSNVAAYRARKRARADG